MANKNDRKKFLINNFTRDIAIAVLLFSIGMLSIKGYGYISDYKLDNKIASQINPVVIKSNRSIPTYPVSNINRVSYPDGPTVEQLYAFLTSNKDFKFFVYVPGTSISLPVVQNDNNKYYLQNNIFMERNDSGTLFLDTNNDSLKLTGNNIIYGHSMKDGTKFGNLYKFEDKEYFEKNNMIYTYSLTEVIAWKIFSSYMIDINTEEYLSDPYIQTNFSSKSQYFDFIKRIQKKSLVTTDVELTENDDILTFSTCNTSLVSSGGRFVIHAKKVSSTPIE